MYNMGYVTGILLNYNNFAEKHLLTVNEWRKEKESGVDVREGALKDSLLSAVLFQSVTITPPDEFSVRPHEGIQKVGKRKSRKTSHSIKCNQILLIFPK